MNSYWLDALKFHDFKNFGYFIVFAFNLVDEIPQKFIAVKVNVSSPVVFCYVSVSIEIEKPEQLLTLLFIDITVNSFAGWPYVFFH